MRLNSRSLLVTRVRVEGERVGSDPEVVIADEATLLLQSRVKVAIPAGGGGWAG